MASFGVDRRLGRLEGPRGRIFLVALDHGLPAGPLPGLEQLGEFLGRLGDAPFTGILVNPGMVRHVVPHVPPHRGLVVHLSGGTLVGGRPTSKVLTSTPEHAIALGADAVSVQIHVGDPSEDRMIADAGRVVGAAHGLGVPVLVMAYASAAAGVPSDDAGATAHAARVAAELGADLVQLSYSGTSEGLRRIVRGCPAPLILAGGPPTASEDRLLESFREAFSIGVKGIAVGRTLFQNPEPARLAYRIAVLFDDKSPTFIASPGVVH